MPNVIRATVVMIMLGVGVVVSGCQSKTATSDHVAEEAAPAVNSDTSSSSPVSVPSDQGAQSVAEPMAPAAETPPTSAADEPAPKRSGRFSDSQGFVFAGTSESDFGDFLLGANVGNTDKMNTMVQLGMIEMIPNGTRGELLTEGQTMGKSIAAVRVTSGSSSGRTVWVLTEDFH